MQRKKVTVRISKDECLLILRSYRQHPSNWADVLADVKANVERLPQPAQNLYRTATFKQLKERVSVKLSKLIGRGDNIEDNDIRFVYTHNPKIFLYVMFVLKG